MKEIAKIRCCAPGAEALSTRERERLAAAFKALGDPTRVAIVNCLAQSESMCVCQFDSFGLSQPTISHHLKVLREAGLVTATRRGTWMFYRLVPDAVASLAFALGGGSERELEPAAA